MSRKIRIVVVVLFLSAPGCALHLPFRPLTPEEVFANQQEPWVRQVPDPDGLGMRIEIVD